MTIWGVVVILALVLSAVGVLVLAHFNEPSRKAVERVNEINRQAAERGW